MRRSITTSLVLSIFLAIAWSGTTAARPAQACGPGSVEGVLPAAPEGSVTIQTIELTADCRLVDRGIQVVLLRNIPDADPGGSATLGTVSASEDATGGVAALGSASGCCWGAYNVQRTWDCCGILLNEYWLEFDWSTCGGGVCTPWAIRWYAGQDGAKWKTLSNSCGPGWSPIAASHGLAVTSGGLGSASVTLEGHQEFGYKGGFDCSGNDYRNSYTNSITGIADGNWTCSYSYNWKKSLAFVYQAWCGTGNYAQK